jgi:large repetitive protein
VNRSVTTSYTPDDRPATVVEADGSGASRTTTATFDPMGNQLSSTLAGGGGASAVGWWKLNQTTGTAVSDFSGTGTTATATSGVTWTGDAASFPNATTAQIATAGPVVNAAANFTVSAWAQLSSTGVSASVVSEENSQFNAFALQYSGPDNAWAFLRASSDDPATSGPIRAKSTAAAVTGQWVHLVGVFDAGTSTMSFYLNGALAGTNTNSAPLAGTGPLVIGRGQRSGAPMDPFRGSVSNVQVYNRALSAGDVTALYGAGRSGGTVGAPTTTVSRTLDKRGLPLTATDQLGNVTNFAYDEAGQLALTTAPTVPVETGGGASTQVRPVTITGYNTFGEPAEVTDPNGNTVTSSFDPAGHPVAIHRPSYTAPGSTTAIDAVSVHSYNNVGQLVSESDPLNNTTAYTYDQLGHLVRTVDPAGGAATATYDTNGDRLSVTDASGAQTQATYDFLGRPLTNTTLERFPSTATATSTLSYAASASNPGGAEAAMVTSPTGVITRQGFNNVGEKISATDGAGNITTFGYDFLGRPTTTMLPDGTSTETGYNPAGNPTSTTRKANGGAVLAASSATFDGAGRMVSATDPRGSTITLTRDASGAISQEVQPVAAGTAITTAFAHDAVGNRTRFTDGRGNPLIYTYNSWNLQQTTVEPATGSFTAAADRTITTAYDAAGRPITQTQPGGVTVNATFDSRGNLTGQTGAGAEVATASRTFGYDALGRVTSAATTAVGSAGQAGYAPTSSETFTYNDRGSLLTATGSGGASSFGYNLDGAMTSRADAAGTSAYTYDTAGRVATATDAASGSKATYGYNTLNQVSQIAYSAGATAGDTRTLTYDGLHRLTGDTLKTTAAATVASIAYGYDGDNNLTSKTTTGFTGSATHTYGYDQANRLTSWNNGTTTTTYGYDASGNRTKVGAATYVYNARDELISDGGSTYTYTARGTLASQITGQQTQTSASDAYGQAVAHNGQAYTYDALARTLTAGTLVGPAAYTFAFSGTANLVAGDGANTYARDPDGALLGVGNAAAGGGTTAGTGTIAWTDQHGDVVGRFTNTATTLAGSTTYDPLGNVTATVSPQGQLGYQSGWTDRSTGNVNMAARWYNPAIGQFSNRDTIAQDPIPNSAAGNPFAYVSDNPMTGTDPSGHGWLDLLGDTFNTVTHWVTRNIITPVAHTIVQYVVVPIVHSYRVLVRSIRDGGRLVYQWVRHTLNSIKRFTRTVWTKAVRTIRTAINVVRRIPRALQVLAKSVSDTGRKIISAGKTRLREAITGVTRAAQAVARATGPARQKFQSANAAIGNAVIAAGFETAKWTLNHPSVTATIVGGYVGVVCDVASEGAAAMACGGLAGAVASGVEYGLTCAKAHNCSGGEAAMNVSVGGSIGATTAGLGPIVGRLLKGVLPDTLVNYVTGTVSRDVTEPASTATTSSSSRAGFGPRPAPTPREPATGSPPCNSFTAATPVLLADGHRKPISQIRVGDRVLATDPTTGLTAPRPVTATIQHGGPHRMVDIDLPDHTRITATDHHPFYDADTHHFVDAIDLHPGERLREPDGQTVSIAGTRVYAAGLTAYNLTVDDLHTYYAGATPVLVHNSGCSGVALGPAPENAWNTFERVQSKGSPLPGYKGGSAFANDGRAGGQILPSTTTEGGTVTYREWDVNPYIKGVDRGPERIVTGSDGSAYYTNDHYNSFTQFRSGG